MSARITSGSCHKYNFCRDKSFVATNTCLSPHNTRDNHNVVATKVLSRQTRVCRHITLETIIMLSPQKFCRDNITFVVSNTTRVCRDKSFVATNYVCRDKSFVAAGILLSRRKIKETKDVFCRDKYAFVATIFLSRQSFCRDKNVTCGCQ